MDEDSLRGKPQDEQENPERQVENEEEAIDNNDGEDAGQ